MTLSKSLKEPSRVIYVVPDLSIIGAQRIAIDHGLALLASGYEVFWLAGGGGKFAEEIPAARLLSFRNDRFGQMPVVGTLSSLWILARKLTDFGPNDLVVGISPFLNRFLGALKKTKILRSKLVLEDHAYPPRSYADEFSKTARFFYQRTEFLYNAADRIRVLSEESKHYYQQQARLTARVSVFPNLLDVDRIRKLASSHQISASRRTRLVYIGRFVTQKNIGFLLQASALLSDSIDFELLIIGYGPEEERLKKMASDLGVDDKVRFLKSSARNFSWLASADVFPIASLWEGMVTTIGEAMSLGVPVVTTDFIAGPRFFLGSHSERGWIVPEADLEKFVAAILDCLDPDLIKEKVEASVSFIDENVAIQKNIHKFIDFLELDK